MRLTLLAIGKLKAGPEKLLADDYAARIAALGKKAGLSKLVIKDAAESPAATADQRKAAEQNWLLAQIPEGARVWALDERGKSPTSERFSADIRALADQGVADLVMVIGGPDGHGAFITDKADRQISFGAMTWPHRLVRIMVLEQVYRSVTIMVNHPYHRA